MRGAALGGVLALLSGALSVLSFAPVGGFPLSFLSLALLVVLLERASRMRAGFALGFVWGLGAFGAGVSWLYIALERYGGVFPPVAALAIFLFCSYLSIYPGLAGMLYVRWQRGGVLGRALIFAALWVLAEWLRGTLLTGFPWLAVGYSQTPPSPLAGFFPLLGVYGVGGALAFAAGLLGLVASRRALQRLPAAVFVAVLLGGFALSKIQWVEPDGSPLSVSLVQTNIDQSLKWDDAHFDDTLRINAELAMAARGELVVLPEAAFPTSFDMLPPDYMGSLWQYIEGRGATLVMGGFIHDGGMHYSNAAVTLGEGGWQQYAKNHLVPFGEYSPPLFGWFYRVASIPMSQQAPGGANQPPFLIKDRKVAVNICYEDVFGAELIDRLPQAGLMLNLSNLAWYGDSFAQPQHLQIAQARAMETGRPMLRATNTGMTALVLPDGSVPAVLPAFTRGVLEVSVSAYRGMTPYARIGDAVVLAALAVLAGAGLLRRRKITPPSSASLP